MLLAPWFPPVNAPLRTLALRAGLGQRRTMSKPLRFVTKAEALKEEYKGRTNYWLTRPELTGAKDLQVCEATLPAGEPVQPATGFALPVTPNAPATITRN